MKRAIRSTAAWPIARPTPTEPVKVILSMPGCAASAAPASAPAPVTMFSTPSGSPASCASSPRRSAVSGVSSDGFSTTVQPHASAVATFHNAIASGKFHGTIAPTTPTASRRVYAKYSAPAGAAIDVSSVEPSSFVAQPAM